ncbi:MAG: hypothetical protein U0T73_05050 [Chitinophagales bacterium]
MKKNLLVIAMLFRLAVMAQSYPEPDFSGVPMWYDANAGILKNLERPIVNIGTRVAGMYKGESYAYIAGMHSPVKFDVNNPPVIIFKTPNPTEDPSSLLVLMALQVNDHKNREQREYILATGGIAGSKSNLKTIAVDFKKIIPGVYKVIFQDPLPVGEYVFSDPSKKEGKAFAFSVFDPSGKNLGNTGSNVNPGNVPANTTMAPTDDEKCVRFKKMKTAGLGLTIGGGAGFLTSVILLAVGSSYSYDSYGYYSRNNYGAYVAGAILITPSILAAGAGVPLLIIGSRKSRQYCGSTANLEFVTRNKSAGIALNF